MSSMVYGYARVSTQLQNEDRQINALSNVGVPRKNLVIDKQSGKNFERPGYQRLLKKMHSGDTLVIQSIDRLGRNYDEMLDQWRFLTKKKQICIVVLDMPLLDTRKEKDLTGVLISDIVLQLLSYVAQTERDFLRKRVKEGMAIAKANGIHCGRPEKPIPEEFTEIYSLWKTKKISSGKACEALKVSRNTFMKWVDKQKTH